MQGKYTQGRLRLSEHKQRSEEREVSAYASRAPLRVLRSFSAWIEVVGGKDRQVLSDFLVVEGAGKSLLGRSTAVALGVLFLGSEINACEGEIEPAKTSDDPEVFRWVPDELVHFEVDPLVAPTRNAYYSIPAAFRGRARDRLALMEKQGIIEPVKKPPKWIWGMSLVPKGKSDFRLVVNMRAVNKAIRRAYHRLPTIEEMKVSLVGAKYFTRLDLKSAFHHLMLDEDSRELMTFQTEAGMRRTRA
jgi:hypothetical protein